jgi:YfiH family protein
MSLPTHRTPSVFAPFDTLIAAESTRHGGVSAPPFASLNLGINTDDSADNVNENRRRFFRDIGAETFGFSSSLQVHGTEVYMATTDGRVEGYDALITNQPGLLIGVTVADCVPILIYDRKNRAVAAIHAGWRGTVGGIVTCTLTTMKQQFGTTGENCYGYIGTCIDTASFEIGAEVADQFDPVYLRTNPGSQKTCADLKSANANLLRQFGVPPMQIAISPFSTVVHNADYFSYRAEHGQTGRMLAVVGVRE